MNQQDAPFSINLFQ